jgi:netrin receptor unc-5
LCNDKFAFLDLRKEFDTPPYSQQIELGSQAELRCHPPKGSPEARVSHWLKNGEKIEDSNLIQSAAGNLLILQARMTDMANYTCVATNDAIERQSQPAAITVFGKKNKHLNILL